MTWWQASKRGPASMQTLMSQSKNNVLYGTEVRFSRDAGYHLVAQRELAACGTLVLQESPYALGMAPQLTGPTTCRACCAPLTSNTKGLLPCPHCNRATWCSAACCKKDAAAHSGSGECALYQDQPTCTVLGSWCREATAALRYLYKGVLHPPLDAHTSHILASLSQEMGQTWVDALLSAMCGARLQAMMAKVAGAQPPRPLPNTSSDSDDDETVTPDAPAAAEYAVATALGSVAGPAESEQLDRQQPGPSILTADARAQCERALCVVLVNSVEVMPVVGGFALAPMHLPPIGLYRTFSRINHSCRANAVYHHSMLGARILVRLLRPLAAGEQVTVCYTDPLMPRASRRLELALKYAFSCACVRCQQQQQQQSEEEGQASLLPPQNLHKHPSGSLAQAVAGRSSHDPAGDHQRDGLLQDLRAHAWSPQSTDWFLDHVGSAAGNSSSMCTTELQTDTQAATDVNISDGRSPCGGPSSEAAQGEGRWQAVMERMVGLAEQLLDQGEFEEAYVATHATLLMLVRAGGVHPWHHACLQAAALMATAAKACVVVAARQQRKRAREGESGEDTCRGAEQGQGHPEAGAGLCGAQPTGAQGVLRWHARVLCAQLLQCGVVEALLDAGETAVVPHASRVCADLASSACSALVAVATQQPGALSGLDLKQYQPQDLASSSTGSSRAAAAGAEHLRPPAGWVQAQRALWAACCDASGCDWSCVTAALAHRNPNDSEVPWPHSTQLPQLLLQAITTSQARACALSELAYGEGHSTHDAWQFAPFFCQGLDYNVSSFVVERVTQLVEKEGYRVQCL